MYTLSPRKRVPKNMTSVARNTHIPNDAVSCWCSRSAYCSSSRCRTRTVCSSTSCSSGVKIDCSGLKLGFLQMVFVGAANDGGRFRKVLLGRRGGGLPFQAGGSPRIRPGRLTIAKCPRQIAKRQDITDAENRGARG